MQSIFLCIGILALHIILFEWLLFSLLEKEYAFYSKIYNNMIPQALL